MELLLLWSFYTQGNRRFKQFVQNHVAGKWQSQLSGQGSFTPRVALLTTVQYSKHLCTPWVTAVSSIWDKGCEERDWLVMEKRGIGWALVLGYETPACLLTSGRPPVAVIGSHPRSKAAFSKGFGSHYSFVWLRWMRGLSVEEPVRGELVSEELIVIPLAFSWHQPEQCSSPVDYH